MVTALRRIFALRPAQHAVTSAGDSITRVRRGAKDLHRNRSIAQANIGWLETLTWGIVALTTVILPCVVSVAGREPFRAPKEFLLRGSAILIGTVLILGATFALAHVRRVWIALKLQAYATAVVVAWTLVTTATSTNRILSVWSLIYVVACALFFIGSCFAVRDRTWTALYALFVPALINTAALTLQQFRIWDFGRLDLPSTRAALLGNGNDVGAYLLCPAIAAAIVCTITPVRRAPHVLIAIGLAAGILMSQSITAIASYAAAILTMAALRSWKRAVAVGLAIVVISAGAVLLYHPLANRVDLIQKAIKSHDYDTVSSFRLTPFASAVQMFSKHPLVGVGPGCYALWYFEEKIAAEAHHAILRVSGDRLHNYGEAHNDYLQALAVGGLLAFAMLTGALVFLGSLSFRPAAGGLTSEFSRTGSFPLAVGIAVLMIAGFPLEVSAPTVSILYSVALCSAWRVNGSA